jgi:hypothetical protein
MLIVTTCGYCIYCISVAHTIDAVSISISCSVFSFAAGILEASFLCFFVAYKKPFFLLFFLEFGCPLLPKETWADFSNVLFFGRSSRRQMIDCL